MEAFEQDGRKIMISSVSVEQKSKRKKESLTQSQQLGVGQTTCKARQLWSIRSQARQHTVMSHD